MYAVLRLDFYDDESIDIPRDPTRWGCEMGGEPVPSRITGTKVYKAPDDAWNEARRLNLLNADKGAHYFVTLVRLVE